MRIDLKVPYPEKDDAKVLGARWDAAKKIWYVPNAADVTPFLRWIPDSVTATKGSVGGATRQSTDTTQAPVELSGAVTTGPAVVLPHCGCNVLPWEDCEHTAKAWI